MSEAKSPSTAEAFVGSVLKYSISTVVNLGIFGVATLLTNWVFKESAPGTFGDMEIFLNATNFVMTVCILGLDQSYIRFFNEPPGRLSAKGLFRLCFYLAASLLVVVGVLCSLLLSGPLARLLQFNHLGPEVIPFVFVNALFYMVTRFFYLRYRMALDVRLYTFTSILQSFFFKLFYLFGGFFQNQLSAMLAFSLGGLGAFALACLIAARRDLAPRRADLNRQALGVVVPYGLAVAPTAMMTVLNALFGRVLMSGLLSPEALDLYSFSLTLSNIVTAVQIGFASFWGAYMYANYKTEQRRIRQVHDIMNLVVLVFFCLLVAFEDIIFLILGTFREAQAIFPVMMLSAVFTVLMETTAYGSTIARRPIFDTLGNAVALGGNIALCFALAPRLGLMGGAVALALANLGMYLVRTLAGQYYYRTVRYPAKTTFALVLACAVALGGAVLHGAFLPKLAISLGGALVYCLMYRAELAQCWRLALSILKNLFSARKT